MYLAGVAESLKMYKGEIINIRSIDGFCFKFNQNMVGQMPPLSLWFRRPYLELTEGILFELTIPSRAKSFKSQAHHLFLSL